MNQAQNTGCHGEAMEEIENHSEYFSMVLCAYPF